MRLPAPGAEYMAFPNCYPASKNVRSSTRRTIHQFPINYRRKNRRYKQNIIITRSLRYYYTGRGRGAPARPLRPSLSGGRAGAAPWRCPVRRIPGDGLSVPIQDTRLSISDYLANGRKRAIVISRYGGRAAVQAPSAAEGRPGTGTSPATVLVRCELRALKLIAYRRFLSNLRM